MKTIPDYPNYTITKDGQVWSKKKNRWLEPRRNQTGYSIVSLSRKRKRCLKYVHRLVLEAYVGSCPEGMECRHLNGDPSDNSLENLTWGTHSENAQDMVRHGRCWLSGKYRR